jgi:hypothetical protein
VAAAEAAMQILLLEVSLVLVEQVVQVVYLALEELVYNQAAAAEEVIPLAVLALLDVSSLLAIDWKTYGIKEFCNL